MKTTVLVLFTVILLLSFTSSYAQKDEVPKDTISYQVSQNLTLLILSKDYHNLSKDNQVQSILEDFQSRVRGIQESIPTSSSYTIDYQYQNKLEILQSNKIKSYNLSEDIGMTEGFRNQANITDGNNGYRVELNFNDVTEILEADFAAILSSIISELPEKDRYLRYLEYRKDTEQNKVVLTDNRPSGYLDMLSFQAGVGANVYRNKFLTDLTGEIGLQLNHKGILRNQFYVSNNLIFSFDAENNTLINNFTNIGYSRNLSNVKDKSNWLGVEFGILTKRSGEIFQPNTMRIGLNWEAGKHITVSPQLYFNGFFQQVSPGFRIGIGL